MSGSAGWNAVWPRFDLGVRRGLRGAFLPSFERAKGIGGD
jgi:hypothetical protein